MSTTAFADASLSERCWLHKLRGLRAEPAALSQNGGDN